MTYRPIQASLGNEWRILVASILLARTSQVQVRGVLPKLFHRWPDHRRMSEADPAEVAEVIRRCGCHHVRAGFLVRMSREYIRRPIYRRFYRAHWYRWIRSLPGVGQYVFEAWRIFFIGDTDFEPEDAVLREWVGRLREEEG